MADTRAERLAQNEVVFRAINEQIEGIARRLDGDATYEFVCECAAIDCFERVTLTIAEYEAVRADGTRFVLAPGHDYESIERVVDARPGYVVVEKEDAAALVAQSADPRA